MVDGADKVNSFKNNVYINPQDAISNTKGTSKELLPLVEKKANPEFSFGIKKGRETVEFNIPEDAPQNAIDFIDALSKNKSALMKELNIDSDTYDMLAQTAVGIAKKETEFGGIVDRVYKAYREFYIMIHPNRHYSRGMTNLKYTLHVNDKSQPAIKEHMLKFGIRDEHQLYYADKSAIATIILLANFNRRIDLEFTEGFEECEKKYGATRIDALCALWNGARSKALKKGEFNPKTWFYTYEVNKTLKEYQLIKK